jgi:hypothetical protein
MSFLFKKQINHYYNETNHKYANEPYEVTYITNFEDNHTDSIIYYEHVSKGVYGDEGFCIGELIRQTDNWAKVAERICNRYGCELDVDREELVAKEDYILVQTMLAIYAWIEFKEDER